LPILGLAMLLAGCSFLSRSQIRIYTLEPLPGQVANVTGVPIVIHSVELPPGLDRREIVVRQGDRELDVRMANLWQGSLAPLVRHTLAFDLAGRLRDGMVVLPGAARPDGPVRSIDLAFQELAAGPDAKVVLDARWTLRQNGLPDVTHHERIDVDIASLDSGNIAAGMSQALAALADRIVTGL
jgi:uncharacterized lipoprotein YmbA